MTDRDGGTDDAGSPLLALILRVDSPVLCYSSALAFSVVAPPGVPISNRRYLTGLRPLFVWLCQTLGASMYDCPVLWYCTPATPTGPPSLLVVSVPSIT